MNDRLALLAFVALALVGGSLLGVLTAPGPWYAALEKPWFNPPNWVFGPVWSVLYIMIGIAGWRLWRLGDSALLRLWWLQLALNFAWSPAFFSLQSPGLALAIILVLVVAVWALAFLAWRRDRLSALLFLPYGLWVSFATLLNLSIFMLN